MESRRGLKTRAKEEINKNLGLVIGTTFLYTVISGMLGNFNTGTTYTSFVLDIGILALLGPFVIGISKFALNVSNGANPQFKDLFFGFKHLFKSIGLYFLITAATVIGLLAFIIPGIIVVFMFSMAPYVLADNPEIGVIEALKLSCKMMKGKKTDLLVLYLSFFLWMLLGVFTLGLAFIWVAPYQQVTEANFYNELVKDGAICS